MSENSEAKIRYLEMIQSVITRMASNSFMLKGWAVTLVAGIFALSSKDADRTFFLLAYLPVVLFWILDSYYLQLERKYRALYQRARNEYNNGELFDLTTPKSNSKQKTCYHQSFFSRTEIGFYFPLAVLTAIVVCIIK